MQIVKESVPAKINLSLAVVGKRGNMHLIDSIVCPYEGMRDEVTLACSHAKGLSVEAVDGAFTALDTPRFLDFLSPKLQAVSEFFKISGCLKIKKDIPLGGGLGGSSAVLAGVVKCAERLSGIAASREFLLSLGSDVPAMYTGGVLRVRGIGDILDKLDCPAPKNVQVHVVEGGSDSAKCYALYDELKRDGKLPLTDFIPATVYEAIMARRNDLEVPACMLNRNTKETLEALRISHDFALVTGSGSSVFTIDLPKSEV